MSRCKVLRSGLSNFNTVQLNSLVTPAEAGVQESLNIRLCNLLFLVDSRLRGDDKEEDGNDDFLDIITK